MLSRRVPKFTPRFRPRYQVVIGNVSLPVGSSGGLSGRASHGRWYVFALLAPFVDEQTTAHFSRLAVLCQQQGPLFPAFMLPDPFSFFV